MTVALKKQADALLTTLKPDERIELADLLYASVPDELDQECEREIERRLDQYEAGHAEVLTADESFARAQEALHEARRASLGSQS